MSSSLLANYIDEDDYDDYIDQAVNIYRLSSKDSSIIGKVKILDKDSRVTISILNRECGYSNDFIDVIAKNDDTFYKTFIKELIIKINSTCHVLVNDLVMNEDNTNITYRMITQNNDMFTVEGIDSEFANQLIALYNKEKCEPKRIIESSNLGEGNFLIFITLMVIIVLTFMFVYILIK